MESIFVCYAATSQIPDFIFYGKGMILLNRHVHVEAVSDLATMQLDIYTGNSEVNLVTRIYSRVEDILWLPLSLENVSYSI